MIERLIAQATPDLASKAAPTLVKVAGDKMWDDPQTWGVVIFFALLLTYRDWSTAIKNRWSARTAAQVEQDGKQAEHHRTQESLITQQAISERDKAIEQGNELTERVITRLEEENAQLKTRIEAMSTIHIQLIEERANHKITTDRMERYKRERDTLMQGGSLHDIQSEPKHDSNT